MDTGPPHILAACEHGGGVHGCLGRMSKHALASPSISCDASLGLQHVACPCNDHVLSQSFECAFREARTPQLDATHGGRGAALLEALPIGCVPGCRLTPRTLCQCSGAARKAPSGVIETCGAESRFSGFKGPERCQNDTVLLIGKPPRRGRAARLK